MEMPKTPHLQMTMSRPKAVRISLSVVVDLGERHHLATTQVHAVDELVGLNVQPIARELTTERMVGSLVEYYQHVLFNVLDAYDYDSPF